MNGRTHMTFGGASVAVLAGPVHQGLGLGPEFPVLAGALALQVGCIAGLLPDLDEPNALLGRGGWVPRGLGAPVRFLAMILSLPLRFMGYLFKGTLGHRGGTHSLAMAAVFVLSLGIGISLLFGTHADWAIWAIGVGCLSHLLADGMTKHGIPLFWPLTSKEKCFHFLPGPFRIETKQPLDPRETLINLVLRLGTMLLWAQLWLGQLLGRHPSPWEAGAGAIGMICFWVMTKPAKF